MSSTFWPTRTCSIFTCLGWLHFIPNIFQYCGWLLTLLTLYLSQTYLTVPQSEQCKFLHPVWGLLSLKKKKRFLASWVTNNRITLFSGKNKVYLHFERSKTPTWCSCAWSFFWIQGINIITYMNWTIATNETATKITKLLLFQSLNFQEQLTSILTSQ